MGGKDRLAVKCQPELWETQAESLFCHKQPVCPWMGHFKAQIHKGSQILRWIWALIFLPQFPFCTMEEQHCLPTRDWCKANVICQELRYCSDEDHTSTSAKGE